jgi:hypothetical protein
MSAQARPQPDLAGECNFKPIEGREMAAFFITLARS